MKRLACVFALLVVIGPGLAHAQRLSDTERGPFVDAGRSVCISAEKNSPANRPFNLRHSQIAVFCECKVQLMADRFTPEEIIDLSGRNIGEKLMSSVNDIIRTCAQVLPMLK